MEWKTIDSAPEGKILVCNIHKEYEPAIVAIDADGEWFNLWAGEAWPHDAYTHWMPLPNPPTPR